MSSTRPSQRAQNNSSETVTHSSPDSSSINHTPANQPLSEYQVDQIEEKQQDTFRIGFININGIPKTTKNPKNQNIVDNLIKYNFDYFGFAETNCYWPLSNEEDQWHDRVRSWKFKHSKSVTAYFTKPVIPELHQQGGVISMALNNTTNRVIKSGRDAVLGRWSWMTLKGKSNIATTIITGYRPCDNTSGNNTVILQQSRYLQAKQIEECPREIWLKELGTFITNKIQDGHQIVLLTDMNDSVVSCKRLQAWSSKIGIREVVSLTSSKEIPTHQRGRKALDGIYTSYSLQTLKAGYFPFGQIQSDHRALWLDLHVNHIFGFTPPTTITPSARRLQSNIPHIRNRWTQLYSSFLRKHNLIERQFTLESSVEHSMTKAQCDEYEKILELRAEGIRHAEKHCRKLKYGNVPFSPELQLARLEIELWKAASTIKTGMRYSSRKFRRLEHKTGLFNILKKSAAEIEQGEKAAFKQYWSKKDIASKLRDMFMEKRAAEVAEEDNKEASAVIKQQRENEKSRINNRKIKYILKKLNKSSVLTVEVDCPDGTTKELTSRTDIELACLQENFSKYTQTEDTVCMQEPLRSLLGKTGTTEFCRNILEGTAVFPHNTPPYTIEFFNQMKRSDRANQHKVTNHISKEDYIDGWKLMKESTSSASTNGLHFGHMKASAMDPVLADFESSISQLPFSTGYAPSPWKEGTIVMIKKRIGLNKVTALRSIVLTEADFNFNNKMLGRRAISHAEAIHELAPEQYGSRKNKCAIDQALHKRITYDIMRQLKQSGLLCSNDAKSCYDRILHSVASLAYQRIGIPSQPVESMLKCIQDMNHRIRTSFGISKESMSKLNTLSPFQGILQGNGASPTTWVLISVPLLNMLRAQGHGAKFMSPMSKEITHIVGFAFVDDTDLITFDMFDNEKSWEDLSSCMQDAINRWEGGLKTSGGAIVPSKSWIYPIDFKFDNKGMYHYKTLNEIDPSFTVLDKKNVQQQLCCYEASIGKETLGVFLAPDGNNKAALKSLEDKAKKWRDSIKAGHLSPTLAWHAANTTIMKSLEYSLPALTLSYKECNRIMKIVKQGLLNSSRVSISIPSSVVYGPKDEGGFQLNHLYVTQGLMHIEKFYSFSNSNTITGKLIRVSLELSVLEIGIGRDIFSLDYGKFNMLLSDCWIKSIWKFTYDNNINIVDRITKYPLPSREGDVFIMEVFQHQGYSKEKLQILNRCRIYLQVLTLSDIMTGKGNSFTCSFKCKRDHQKHNNFNWPKQPEPSTAMKKIWSAALRKTFGLKAGIIEHNLGPWLHSDTSYWIWFFHPMSTSLFQRFGLIWKVWKRETTRGRFGATSKFKFYTHATRLPISCQRATVTIWSHNRVTYTGSSTHSNNSTINTCNNISPSHLPLEISGDTLDSPLLLEALQQGKVFAVCDGSFLREHKIGTAGWIIESDNQISQTSGSMEVPGPLNVQSACRSELAGIMYTLLHLQQLCKFGNIISSPTINIYCDGLSAIQAIQKCNDNISYTKTNFDILNAISTLRQQLPINIKLLHVKGHQDSGSAYSTLNKIAKLNVDADHLATTKAAFIKQHQRQLTTISLPYSHCDIFISSDHSTTKKINSNLFDSLHHIITKDKLRNYWIDKKDLEHTVNQTDWDLRNKSLANLNTGEQRWWSKHTTGFCGVGSMLVKYKFQQHDNCPRCSQPYETTSHLLQCKGFGVDLLWQDEIKKLKDWMGTQNLH